jgi:hypothetical protein
MAVLFFPQIVSPSVNFDRRYDDAARRAGQRLVACAGRSDERRHPKTTHMFAFYPPLLSPLLYH